MKYFLSVMTVLFTTNAIAAIKPAPLPPKRPAELNAPAPVFNTDPNVYGAIVKNGQVMIRAPLGSDVQVDVDGNSFTVDVDKSTSIWNKVLPWKW